MPARYDPGPGGGGEPVITTGDYIDGAPGWATVLRDGETYLPARKVVELLGEASGGNPVWNPAAQTLGVSLFGSDQVFFHMEDWTARIMRPGAPESHMLASPPFVWTADDAVYVAAEDFRRLWGVRVVAKGQHMVQVVSPAVGGPGRPGNEIVTMALLAGGTFVVLKVIGG